MKTEILKPQFKELRFKNQEEVNAWLDKEAHVKINFIDTGQDLIQMHLHKTGEILDCGVQGWIWNGRFVDMKKLKIDHPIVIQDPQTGEWKGHYRLVVIELEFLQARKEVRHGR